MREQLHALAERHPRATRRTTRGLGLVGLGVFGGVLGAPYALTHASADTYLGPHPTTVSTNNRGSITADGGPITSLEVPFHSPFNIGATATLHAPPAALGNAADIPTLAAEYAQLAKGVGENFSDVRHKLEVDALEIDLEIASATAFIGWLASQKLRGAYEKIGERVAHPRAVVAGLACLACAASMTSQFSTHNDSPTHGDAIFDGTPLAGSHLTGAYGPTAEKLISLGLNAYEYNELFYKRVTHNTDIALKSGESIMPFSDNPDIATGVFITDFHCNLNMTKVIVKVAEAANANFIADGGDTTLGGTSAETICATDLSKHKPSKTVIIRVKGNHDSTDTIDAEEKAGDIVLQGKPVTVDGITFLGDSDPRQSGVGTGTTDPSGETTAELGDKLAAKACEATATNGQKLDVLMVHDPDAAQATIDSSCVQTTLTGHLHERIGPITENDVMRYVGDTAGGAKAGGITIGPLNQQAGIAIMQWSKTTGKVVAYRPFSVETDSSVIFPAATLYPENMPVTSTTNEQALTQPTPSPTH